MKKGTFSQIVSAHWYVVKMAYGISKKRVILEFLYQVLESMIDLLTAGVLIRVLLYIIAQDMSYSLAMVFLWGMILLFVLGRLVQHYAENIVLPETDVKLYEGIHQKLYQKACQVDLYCFEDSDFYNQYMLAIQKAQVLFPQVLRWIAQIICGFVTAVAAGWMVFSLDRYAVLFLIFPIIGSFVFKRILLKRLFQMEKEVIAYQRIADYVNRTIHLAEYAKEMRLSKVFRLMKKQYDRSVDAICQTVNRYAGKNAGLYGVSQMFTFTFLFELAAVYAGYRVLVSGTMTFAAMAVFQGILCEITWLILDFTERLMNSVKNSLEIEQVRGFMDYRPRIPEDAPGALPDLTIYSIEFSHVWFGYREGSYILKDVSFQVHSDQSVAIAGYNGAGKSTLIKLLLRLYDPDQGVILVNGRDIREYQVRAYRNLFTTAFQDGKIFADTVKENVLMGRRETPEKDSRTVWQALELAGIAEEVRSWPLREQTILTREFSKEGIMPSGGQCQKIIAARAFAKDSPAAVFDEPSSALDPIAEYELFEHIQSFGSGKILFYISHRLSSVQNADMVFFMENGRITERGTHRELMEKEGSYARLYRIQAKNYQADLTA